MDTKQTDPLAVEILKKNIPNYKDCDRWKVILLKDCEDSFSPLIIKSMQEYHEVKSKQSLVSEWQCCPKCAGAGIIPSLPGSTNTTSLCDACNGSKILVKPIANDELGMKYALLQEQLQEKDRELKDIKKHSDRLAFAAVEVCKYNIPELLITTGRTELVNAVSEYQFPKLNTNP